MRREIGMVQLVRVGVSSVVLAILAAPAWAEPPPEDVELRYVAPAECPPRATVETQIRERATAVRFVDGASRVFDITVANSDAGYTGTLVVDGAEGKQLAAPRCDDLVTALALVVAIAIDPQAALREPAPPPPPPAPPPPPLAPPPTPPARAREARLEIATTLGVGLGVTPDPLVQGSVELRAVRGRVTIGIAALGGRDSTTSDMATARFTWLAARPATCWTVVAGIGACAHAEIGVTRAEGADIIYARTLTRLWLAAGGHVAVQWPTRGRVFGQLELGASVPVLRDRYRFNPGTELHATGAVIGWAELGAGLRF